MIHAERLHRLDSLLTQFAWLWRPQPYKEIHPTWCEGAPELQCELLGLEDGEVALLSENESQLIERLSLHFPELRELANLIDLPTIECHSNPTPNPHLSWEIPGRKWRQITSFSECTESSGHDLVEWCGGKGHLGRLLATQWQRAVTTLDYNTELCNAGEALARRAKTPQRFIVADALSPTSAPILSQHHAVALHACGELHRRLVINAVEQRIPALDLAPCCYYHKASTPYQSFTSDLQLRLDRDDLRLAVTNTATASAAEIAKRNREMAWKLGFDQWRRDASGDNTYRSINSTEKNWLHLDFSGFCRQLALREGIPLHENIDWSSYEKRGWHRFHSVARLSLVRFSFRRALELWLVTDIATYLQKHHYQVTLGLFCSKSVTPRNILISARREQFV